MRLDVDELRRLAWQWCIDCKACADYGYHALGDVLRLRAEADELRRLAWEWCIRAAKIDERARHWEDAFVRQERTLRLTAEALNEMRAAEARRDALPTAAPAQTEPPVDDEALRIVPHGSGDKVTLTISKPEPPIYIDPAHDPIESLGPVPVGACDMRRWEDVERAPTLSRAIAWLVRDAVRRGARLEGEDR